jgi:hypothetical protein
MGAGKRDQSGAGGSIPEAHSEPDRYSATLVRTIEDGARRETHISREARLGEQRREEWTQGGKNLALIWRPDIGKAFLLDLDRRVYVEIDDPTVKVPESRAGAGNPRNNTRAQNLGDLKDSKVQTIDQYFDDNQPPAGIDKRILPQVVIDGHPCAVDEQRYLFPDEHIEIIRTFRAHDLSGLLLRIESETEPGSARVTTERRDVRIEVSPDAFIVPTNFKRVEQLSR